MIESRGQVRNTIDASEFSDISQILDRPQRYKEKSAALKKQAIFRSHTTNM
jgi:hypothetical protein